MNDTHDSVVSDPTSQLVAQLPSVRGYHVLNSYILCSRLGAGGVGAVYMGYHVKIHRPVAIKLLNPVLVGQSESAIKRFEREAILASKINSQHLVGVTDAGSLVKPKLNYIVMELVKGENVEERIMRTGKALTIGQACSVAYYSACGLADAHAQGVLHRDLKPANVMISSSGRVLLADLGIATSLNNPSMHVTMTNEFVGTPQYMSPEQIQGDPVDERSDIYSLGVTLYYMLSGQHPFYAATPYAVFDRILQEGLPDINALRSDVPAAIQDILRDCTNRIPDERIKTAGQLADTLKDAVEATGSFADLSDSEAGSNRSEQFVDFTDVELQEIAQKTETLVRTDDRPAISEPPSKLKRIIILLIFLICIVVGGGVIWVKSTPLDKRLIRSVQAGDYPKAVELARKALTPDALPKATRASLQADLIRLLHEKYPNLADLAEKENRSAAELLGLFLADGAPEAVALINTELRALVRDGDWMQINQIVEILSEVGALLGNTQVRIADGLVNELVALMSGNQNLAIAPMASVTLQHFADNGVEKAKQLQKLLEFSNAMEFNLDHTAAIITISDSLKLQALVRPRLIQELASLARQASPDAAVARQHLEALSKRGDSEAFKQLELLFGESVDKKDFAVAEELLAALRDYPSADKDRLQKLGQKALQQYIGSVTRDAYGTVQNVDSGVDAFLAQLVDMGVPGAAQWLIEARVAWHKGGHMVVRSGVNKSQSAELVELLNSVLTNRGEGTRSEELFARACFLSAEAYYWKVISAPDDSQRRIRALSGYFGGLGAGCSECAVRLIEGRAVNPPTITDGALAEAGFVFPAWHALESVIKTPKSVAARSMGLYGLALGGLALADPPVETSVAINWFVQAAEQGYWPATDTLNTYFKDQLNSDQRRRAGIE